MRLYIFTILSAFIALSYVKTYAVSTETITSLISQVRVQEKATAIERLSYIHSDAYFIKLCKANHKLIHNKNAAVFQKIGFTALNAIAAPATFVVIDGVLGPISKDIMNGVHTAVHNNTLSRTRKIATITASIPAVAVATPASQIYRTLVQLPSIVSAGVTYAGGAYNDYARTRIILNTLNKNNINSWNNWHFKRLTKKVSRLYGYPVSKDEVTAILSESLNPNSPIFTHYLDYKFDQWRQRKNPNSIADNTTRISPDKIKKVGVPLGLDQLALLVKFALEKK